MSRPATERTETDITPMTQDEGINALSDLIGGAKPEESEAPEVDEAEEEQEEIEEDTVSDDGESESSADEETEESETQDSDEEESDELEEEVAAAITLPDGTKIDSEEAVRGYLRQSDYTRKTQALAEEVRKSRDESSSKIEQLSRLVSDLEQQLEQEPNWTERIKLYGADQVMQEQLEWNQKQSAKRSAETEVQRHREQTRQQLFVKARSELMSGTYEPAWTDESKLEAGLQTIAQYAHTDYGISADELSDTPDSRIFVILDKARKYDELQKKAPKVKAEVKAKPKPIKPGSRNTVKVKKPIEAALNQARKSGTDEDALAALAGLRRAS